MQASQYSGAIVDTFIKAGFSVSRLRMVHFDAKAKSAFQQTHTDSGFQYEGRAVVIELLKHRAVDDLKPLVGTSSRLVLLHSLMKIR